MGVIAPRLHRPDPQFPLPLDPSLVFLPQTETALCQAEVGLTFPIIPKEAQVLVQALDLQAHIPLHLQEGKHLPPLLLPLYHPHPAHLVHMDIQSLIHIHFRTHCLKLSELLMEVCKITL